MRYRDITAGLVASLAGIAHGQLDEPFPPVFELGSLLPDNGGDGSLGAITSGLGERQQIGMSLATAGDMNGDGIDDFLIGTFSSSPGGRNGAGSAFVVFGREGGFGAEIDLSGLDGSNGFRIDGAAAGNQLGRSVAGVGDVNGDGFDDVVVGARLAAPNGGLNVGAAYVVFGDDATFPPTLDVGALDGSAGFRIDGTGDRDFAGKVVGQTGDINGDGLPEIGVRARDDLYVVFGSATGFPATLGLSELDGKNGVQFAIDGWDTAPGPVAPAGDVNGDGIGDLLVGEPFADGGRAFVVFGRNGGFGSVFQLADLANGDGSEGFALVPDSSDTLMGSAVAGGGDIDGDGIDDIVLGGPHNYNHYAPGSAHVVFGRDVDLGETFPGTLQLDDLDGSDGFRFTDQQEVDALGHSVASPGDINGDGIDDVAIGAYGIGEFGAYFVIYGRRTSDSGDFPSEILAEQIDGQNGFRLDGAVDEPVVGDVAAVGDANGDGTNDLLATSPIADIGEFERAGRVYLVYGRNPDCPADLDGDSDADADDFFAYLDAFAAGDLDTCDIDGDDDCDADDFFGYLDLFAQGC